MQEKILEWFINGETGVSSKAMAAAIAGIRQTKPESLFGNWPMDTWDFGRCVKFLNEVPEARQHLDKVAALGPTWHHLIDRWAEFEQLYQTDKNKLADKMREIV